MPPASQENLSYSQKIYAYQESYAQVDPLRACLEELESAKQELENLKHAGRAIFEEEYQEILQKVAQAFSDTMQIYNELMTPQFTSLLRTHQQYGLLVLLQEIETLFDETAKWFTHSKSALHQKRKSASRAIIDQGRE